MPGSPPLSGSDIRSAVRAIRRMRGAVTWRRVELDVADALSHRYTRQALQSHPEIKSAYLDRKHGAPAQGGRPPSAAAQARAVRDRKTSERIAELESALDRANERIALMLDNGSKHGVLKQMLEADIEALHRAADGPRGHDVRGRTAGRWG